MTTNTYEFVSPATGKCVPVEAIFNEMLSSKVLGDGIAIFPTENEVVAPCDGVVSRMSEATHAITILDMVHDIELMLCADIEEGMHNPNISFCVEPGQVVRTGEILFTCDVEDIRAHGFQVDFPCIITNPLSEVSTTSGDVVRGHSHVMACESIG